jgi:hypothetical protein
MNFCSGYTIPAFRRHVRIRKTPFAVEQKAQQFPQISTHLMVAEYAETNSAVMNFKGSNFKS